MGLKTYHNARRLQIANKQQSTSHFGEGHLSRILLRTLQIKQYQEGKIRPKCTDTKRIQQTRWYEYMSPVKSKETGICLHLDCSKKNFSQILQTRNTKKYNWARASTASPKALKCSEILQKKYHNCCIIPAIWHQTGWIQRFTTATLWGKCSHTDVLDLPTADTDSSDGILISSQ
jgi:hypothetical protein